MLSPFPCLFSVLLHWHLQGRGWWFSQRICVKNCQKRVNVVLLLRSLQKLFHCMSFASAPTLVNTSLHLLLNSSIWVCPYHIRLRLLTSVKRRKLKWYGHFTRSSGLAKTILQGTVQGGRRRGTQRKRWEDNIKEWTYIEWNIILRKAENREEWGKLPVKSTVVPQRSARQRER